MGFPLSLGVVPYSEPGVPNPGAGSLQDADVIERCPQNLHWHLVAFVRHATVSSTALMEEACHFDLYLDPYIQISWNLDRHYSQPESWNPHFSRYFLLPHLSSHSGFSRSAMGINLIAALSFPPGAWVPPLQC